MRAWLAVVALVCSSCQPSTEPVLMVSAKPNRIDNHGQITELTATATAADGTPGKGSVTFTSMAGTFKTPETATLTAGAYTTGFSCDVAQDPACVNLARVIVEWTSGTQKVTADVRVLLDTTGGGGGGGSDGGNLMTTSDGGRRDAGVDPNDAFCNLPDISACYHFDEGSGPWVYDVSGHQHDALNAANRNLRWDAGFDGGGWAVHVQGQDSISTRSDPELELGTKFTVQVRALPTSLNASMWIVSKQFSWGLAHDPGGADVCFFVSTSSGLEQACSTGGSLVSKEWRLITGTYDGTTIRLYLDRTLEGSKMLAGTPSTNVGVLAIGSNGTNVRYVGLIDDLRILRGVYPP